MKTYELSNDFVDIINRLLSFCLKDYLEDFRTIHRMLDIKDLAGKKETTFLMKKSN